MRKIRVVNKNTKQEQVFNSIREAAAFVEVPYNTLASALRRKANIANHLVSYIYDEIEVKVGDIVWFQGFKKEVIEYMSDVAEVSRDAARKGVERALKNGCKFKGFSIKYRN